MKMWILLAQVSLRDGEGFVKISAMDGWAVRATQEEARGSFLVKVVEKFPKYAIDELHCEEIPQIALRAALGIEQPDSEGFDPAATRAMR